MKQEVKIELKVSVGSETYFITDQYDIDAESGAGENVSEFVDLVAFKMQSALNPCYYDHNVTKIEISDLFKGNNNVDE
jgi:hypothetical protein